MLASGLKAVYLALENYIKSNHIEVINNGINSNIAA